MPSQLSPLRPSAANTSSPHSPGNRVCVCVWHPIRIDLSSLSGFILPVCSTESYSITLYWYFITNVMFKSPWSAWINSAALYLVWIRWSWFDNILTNNQDTLFIQSFRCCHRADIHPEHVHSLCRPDALRMCHLCEDITGLGGGRHAQFAHQMLTFERLKNDASLSSRELNSPL